jgi:SAM-dependent methyltransferase
VVGISLNKNYFFSDQENSASILESAFALRGSKYVQAGCLFPMVRNAERQALIGLLLVQKNDLILDLQSAAGYLADGIKEIWGHRVGTICVEPSSTLRAGISKKLHLVLSDPLEKLSIPTDFVTKVGCLAGTHHAPSPESLFDEAFRVLKPGGIFAVADVRTGSPVDEWLNGFVDSQLLEGHKGVFQHPGNFGEMLLNSGFGRVFERTQTVPWDFENVDQSVEFCQTMFGLIHTPKKIIKEKILTILPFENLPCGRFRINWELIYASGVKEWQM